MTLTFLYFLTLSGTTFWTGPRIVYPTEILQISTAAMLVALLVRAIGHMRGNSLSCSKTREPQQFATSAPP
jgi:hypothetical protein